MESVLDMKWRVGHKLGRTIYAIPSDSQGDDDHILIGIMDSADFADHVVADHNRGK
jgi:hypothetical protein